MNPQLKSVLEKCAKLAGNVDATELVAEAEKSFALQKELREKASNITGDATGFGAELRQQVMYKDELYSMVANSNDILKMLPGNHGQIDSVDQVKVPVIGEMDYFKRGKELGAGDSIGGAMVSTNSLGTARATLNFKKFKATIIISKEELKRAVGGPAQLWNKVQENIKQGMNKSITSFIINGDDSVLTSTLNNVTVEATWAEDHRNGTDGIRAKGIANGVVGGSEAYSRGIMKKLFGALDNYTDDSSKLLWVFSNKFANHVRFDSTYSTQDVFGNKATNTEGGYVLAPEGIKSFVTKEYTWLVKPDGTVGATGNTCVSGALIYAPAIQYAFGADMEIIAHEYASAIAVDVEGYFAFDIVNDATTGIGKTVAVATCLA